MNDKTVHILWAEDDADDVFLIRSCLAELQYDIQCHFFDNGMQLINYLHTDERPVPRFIVLDLNMPLVDGCDTLDIIKADTTFRDIPAIVYSTSPHEHDIARAKQHGADEYLVKPTNYRQVFDNILYMLGKYASIQITLSKG